MLNQKRFPHTINKYQYLASTTYYCIPYFTSTIVYYLPSIYSE